MGLVHVDRSVWSNAKGEFVFEGLPPGMYEVRRVLNGMRQGHGYD
ncbi:MAG: hypothetical protein M2R45_04074 [Verrucomicrobia subdivision 3 bacterium]|nr:hypothetical protein [Limisphaerales bacterium]MCS1417013.1 hypothetical protein [Limisphaerales bacterium]